MNRLVTHHSPLYTPYPYTPHIPNTLARFRRLGFLLSFPGLPKNRHRARFTEVQDWNQWTERNPSSPPSVPNSRGSGPGFPIMSRIRLAGFALLSICCLPGCGIFSGDRPGICSRCWGGGQTGRYEATPVSYPIADAGGCGSTIIPPTPAPYGVPGATIPSETYPPPYSSPPRIPKIGIDEGKGKQFPLDETGRTGPVLTIPASGVKALNRDTDDGKQKGGGQCPTPSSFCSPTDGCSSFTSAARWKPFPFALSAEPSATRPG